MQLVFVISMKGDNYRGVVRLQIQIQIQTAHKNKLRDYYRPTVAKHRLHYRTSRRRREIAPFPRLTGNHGRVSGKLDAGVAASGRLRS
jgi:hypothetical protein